MSSKARIGGNFELTSGGRRALTAFLSLLALLGLSTLCACSDQSSVAEPEANPLLYEVRGPNGDLKGWLLGTIHVLPNGVRWRTRRINQVVDQADLLVVEIADLEDSATITRAFAELGTTTGLPTLTQRVAPDKRLELRETVTRAGLSLEDFRHTETWAAALMLSQQSALGSAANGVDRAIIKDFGARPVLELEGAEAQLSIFDQLAEADQRVLLSSAIKGPGELRTEAQQLIDAWLSGDYAAIEDATTAGIMEDREVRDALLVQRNLDWMNQLEPKLRGKDKPLVAVGAAHLVGEVGLVALLKRRGFTVRRVD